MFRALLLGVVTAMVSVGVAGIFPFFDGGPKSLGDELIVRTSRFLAIPKRNMI